MTGGVEPFEVGFCHREDVSSKVVLAGFGVQDPSHIGDLSKPRTAGDELGAEVLRRMLRPYGWTVENMYFDSRVGYHWDCILGIYAEGVIGLPRQAVFTDLPFRFHDWDIIDLELDEIARGAANTVPLADNRVLIPPNCPLLAEELTKRDITPVEVDRYDIIFANYGSGLHCSMVSLWRER